MKLHVPLRLRPYILSYGACAVVCSLNGNAQAVELNKAVIMDDSSSGNSTVAASVAGESYGRINAGSALTIKDIELVVNHGGDENKWAAFTFSAEVKWNENAFAFSNVTLKGDGNLAFFTKAGDGNNRTNGINLGTLNASPEFTGRILLANEWNNGVQVKYAGTSLQNAELVLATLGQQYAIGATNVTLPQSGTLYGAHSITLTDDATVSGISTGSASAKLLATGSGTTTLTLTGQCTTNSTYVFAGNVGTANAYFNLAHQGGNQTFSGANYFGSVSVEDGSLTLGGTTTVKGNVAVTGGTLDLSGATLVGALTVTLGGGQIDHLTVNGGQTLQLGSGGTLGDLTLNGGTIALTGDGIAYTLTGKLDLGIMTTIDFSGSTGYADGTTLFSGVSLADGITWNEDEWSLYFALTGTDQNWRIVYNESDGTLQLAANTAADLTWDNASASGLWNSTDANWGDASTFHKGDAVTFSATTGAVTVDEAGVLASKVTVNNGAVMTLGGGTVTAPMTVEGGAQLTVDNTIVGAVTLTGNSTLTVGEGTLDGVITIGDADSKLLLTKTGSLSSSASVAGAGTVEINWGTQSGNVNAQLSAFTGTLSIVGGRYEAGNAAAALGAASVNVSGGQISLTGGTWNKTFHLNGAGWAGGTDAASGAALVISGAATTVSGAVSLGENAGIHASSNATFSANVTMAAGSAIRIAGGTSAIGGRLVLTGNATLDVSSTLNLNGGLSGAGQILTKTGAGVLNLNDSGITLGQLTIEQGTVHLGTDKTWNFDTVTVQSGARLQDAWRTKVTITTLNMEDGSILDLNDGGGNSTAQLNHEFKTMNVTGVVQVLSQGNGEYKMLGKIVGKNGTLNFDLGTDGSKGLYLQSNLSGVLNVVKNVGGTMSMSGTSTYTGDTTVKQGKIDVTGSISGNDNHYIAEGSGTLQISGANGRIQNAALSVKRNGSTNATMTHATVGTEKIFAETGQTGTLNNAAVEISASNYGLEGMTLANSAVTMASGTLDIADVRLTGATRVSGALSVSEGTLRVNDTSSLGSGKVTIKAGTGARAAADAPRLQQGDAATLTARDASKDATIENHNSITASGITGSADKATAVDGVSLDVSGAYSLEYAAVTDSLISLQSGASVSLNHVTIGAGTAVSNNGGAIALNNSRLEMNAANTTDVTLNAETNVLSVGSTGLAGYTTLSGTLTLGLAESWVYDLVGKAGGNFTSIELTFTDVDANVWSAFKEAEGSHLAVTGALDTFNTTVTFGDTAGQVIIATAPPTNIPEPATSGLALFGLGSLLARRRRKA